MKLKTLPIGQSSFENIIKNNNLYVDKTKKIYQLITSTQFNFLARPRRFGKSLLVSTLKAIFEGKKELFTGLWICNSDVEWKKHPVIVIDFNLISSDTPDELKSSLEEKFLNIAKEHDIELHGRFLKSKFEELVVKLNEKYVSEVVILIDEYDKPIISHLGYGDKRLEIAKENREILKNLFGTLKGENVIKRLRFLLLTGVSKFSRAGVFSDLNNLDDITMQGDFADILGITDEEVDVYFNEYLSYWSERLKIDKEMLHDKIKNYYNGYRFSEEEVSVYSPFSLLKFFKEGRFKNYWFETGTPTFLISLIKEKDYYLPNIENIEVEESIFSAYEIEDLNIESLLFQTGYLTIKDYDYETGIYILSYPNKEVRYSFLKILYKEITKATSENVYLKLGDALRKGEIDRCIEIIKSIFSSISYTLGSKLNEAQFHSLFYLMLNAGGAPADMELLTSRGRIDMVVEYKDRIYIIEFKCNQSSDKAIAQIEDKGYAEKYLSKGKEIYLLGINFDLDKRNIGDWKVKRV